MPCALLISQRLILAFSIALLSPLALAFILEPCSSLHCKTLV